jgi:uncharacterized membrane protein
MELDENLLGMIDLSASSIISGLFFGAVGYWLYRKSRAPEKTNFPILAIGIALMVYPYLTKGPLADWGVGIALCGLAYFLWDR